MRSRRRPTLVKKSISDELSRIVVSSRTNFVCSYYYLRYHGPNLEPWHRRFKTTKKVIKLATTLYVMPPYKSLQVSLSNGNLSRKEYTNDVLCTH